MRVAGVRCDGGRVVWVDAGELPIRPLDHAVVITDGAELNGHVFVIPELLFQPPNATGRLVRVEPRLDPLLECADLPGAEMPPLGSEVRVETLSGTVIQIDPVRHTVTVATHGGEQIELKASAVSSSLSHD